MVFKLFPNIKKIDCGITLIEIIIVISMISLFSLIIIANFPAMLKQFALSRATYKLAQDVRKTLDLGLSGISIKDAGDHPIKVIGYGIYIELDTSTKQYLIYADVNYASSPYNQKYNGPPILCDIVDQQKGTSPLVTDCIIGIINLIKENSNLYILDIVDGTQYIHYDNVSINFNPPNPTTTITTPADIQPSKIGIVLSNGSATRTVWINTSGLIYVE